MRHEFVVGEPQFTVLSVVCGHTAAEKLPKLSNVEQDVCAVCDEIGYIAIDRHLFAMQQEK